MPFRLWIFCFAVGLGTISHVGARQPEPCCNRWVFASDCGNDHESPLAGRNVRESNRCTRPPALAEWLADHTGLPCACPASFIGKRGDQNGSNAAHRADHTIVKLQSSHARHPHVAIKQDVLWRQLALRGLGRSTRFALKPFALRRSIVPSRIDSSSSTIETTGLFVTPTPVHTMAEHSAAWPPEATTHRYRRHLGSSELLTLGGARHSPPG